MILHPRKALGHYSLLYQMCRKKRCFFFYNLNRIHIFESNFVETKWKICVKI